MKNLSEILLKIQKKNTLLGGEYFFASLKENDRYLAYYGYRFVNKIAVIPVGGSDYINVYDKENKCFTKIQSNLENFENVQVPTEFAIGKDYSI